MSEIIKQLKFKGPWRKYQKRVLKNLTPYFSDRKLNIVAAPGAGKTVLGIEVVRRLGYPVLIFSPTITIKKQWKSRILESFLPSDFDHKLISTDINKIKEITSITYQKLHSVYRKDQQKELIEELKRVGVKTIVLDEAHHLRSDWYNSLYQLIDELSNNGNDPNFKIISLTATPPYDVEEKEWNNYYELCGPVDEEISVPELVQAKDLCPHQDLLYFSSLDEDEKILADKFNKNRENFLKYLMTTSEVKNIIENSPFVKYFKADDDHIYDDIEFTVAIISYLLFLDKKDKRAKEILQYIQIDENRIPKFDYEVAQNLVNGILGRFKEYFEDTSCIKEKLKNTNLLKSSTKVDLTGSADLKKIFARSKNKLNSIVEITNAEYKNLGNDLREVILLDNIGENTDDKKMTVLSAFKRLNVAKRQNTFEFPSEFLGELSKQLKIQTEKKEKLKEREEAKFTEYQNALKTAKNNTKIEITENNIAYKIWKDAQRECEQAYHKHRELLDKIQDIETGIKLAVLTGSLVIIPKTAKFELEKILETRQIQVGSMSFSDYDEDYLKVESHGDINTVEIISELFEMGQINVLIGTQALLGEGWDSPCLNTLILGSVVGSFMLSNQMRGRAIRVDKNNPNKTADIWHLISLENVKGYGYDYEIISKRFDTFDGINYKKNTVESGIERLGITAKLIKNTEYLNYISLRRAKNRNKLVAKWEKCLYNNSHPLEAHMKDSLKIENEQTRLVVCKCLIPRVLPVSIATIGTILFLSPVFLVYTSLVCPNLLFILILVILSYLVLYSAKTVNYHIAKTLLKALAKYSLTTINYERTEITEDKQSGTLLIDESSCDYQSKSKFYSALSGVYTPNVKQRFLLKLLKQKNKVLYVPIDLDTLDKVKYFAKELEKNFGKIEIIDLENPSMSSSQKRQLMKSRYNDFLSGKVKKQRRWG